MSLGRRISSHIVQANRLKIDQPNFSSHHNSPYGLRNASKQNQLDTRSATLLPHLHMALLNIQTPRSAILGSCAASPVFQRRSARSQQALHRLQRTHLLPQPRRTVPPWNPPPGATRHAITPAGAAVRHSHRRVSQKPLYL